MSLTGHNIPMPALSSVHHFLIDTTLDKTRILSPLCRTNQLHWEIHLKNKFSTVHKLNNEQIHTMFKKYFNENYRIKLLNIFSQICPKKRRGKNVKGVHLFCRECQRRFITGVRFWNKCNSRQINSMLDSWTKGIKLIKNYYQARMRVV